MNRIEQAAAALADTDVLALTDSDIMAAANAAGIPMPGRWHLTRIRQQHTLAAAQRMLADLRNTI